MSGRNSFETLRVGMTSAQTEAVARKVAAIRADVSLAELRQARQLTQETLSGTLHVGQASSVPVDLKDSAS